MTSTRAIGSQWESLAEAYLHRHGLKTIARNFNCRLGEIDLVMQDGEYLVFAEVRYRRQRGYGSGAETVTRAKQQRIIRAALRFLQFECHRAQQACRFDVVSMGQQNGEVTINWIRNAFTAD